MNFLCFVHLFKKTLKPRAATMAAQKRCNYIVLLLLIDDGIDSEKATKILSRVCVCQEVVFF